MLGSVFSGHSAATIFFGESRWGAGGTNGPLSTFHPNSRLSGSGRQTCDRYREIVSGQQLQNWAIRKEIGFQCWMDSALFRSSTGNESATGVYSRRFWWPAPGRMIRKMHPRIPVTAESSIGTAVLVPEEKKVVILCRSRADQRWTLLILPAGTGSSGCPRASGQEEITRDLICH